MPFTTLPGVDLNLHPYDFKLAPLPPPRVSLAQAIAAALNSPTAQNLLDPNARKKQQLELEKLNLENEYYKRQAAFQSGASIGDKNPDGSPKYSYNPSTGQLEPTDLFHQQRYLGDVLTNQERQDRINKAKPDEPNFDSYGDTTSIDSGAGGLQQPTSLNLSGNGTQLASSSLIPSITSDQTDQTASNNSPIPAISDSSSGLNEYQYPTTTPNDYWEGVA